MSSISTLSAPLAGPLAAPRPHIAVYRPRHPFRRSLVPRRLIATAATAATVAEHERTVLDALASVKGRGKSGLDDARRATLDAAVAALEASGAGEAAPAASPLLDGRWRLLYTSRPGTASPIQNTFTGVEGVAVYQELLFSPDTPVPRVNNVVDLPGVGYLKVEAEASTDARPLPGFTPRKGAGLPFGILGVSKTTPPAAPDLRIDFQFDRAAFYFKFLPFTIPYPVPFRLLQDERKGWIDITYMSRDGRFRLTRGNKGTLFILVKDDP